ncbi:alkaline phosphatase family protein [Ichthyenterobacterium sp. W332]|uniref:Alkaline phosphatase family protein n=1 Tax=Microcosmobacter mediterraneus TaxID=3075607 RepID=A0ABU2YLK7_9FLAO|nr:alkaline phosphatase family protein [Ichthyenterobacterium sp. W332]MDT0559040.1 alkaline phosphatase family protein [Ichthyenterobacterium sp. W332]
MQKNKLLVIGWDAADWKIIWPLIANGQMPTLKKMIQNGVHGNMSTMNPPYSPMLWSSVVTGKTPDKHGVLGFIEVMEDNKGVRPVTTNSRKARTVWNILHHKGFKSNLVGWWPSFPAEPINGVVITDKFQKVSIDPKKRKPLEKGTIHPESLVTDFKDLIMFPQEVTSEHILPFIPLAAKIDQEKNNGLFPAGKVLAENVSIHNAATRLLRTTNWDFMAIYYDLIDHFCHSYMKFHPPKLKGVNQDQYEIFKDAVAGAYRFQDMMLERTLELVDDDTTVIIMSDHGFESGNKRLINMPKVQAAAAMDHRQFGMFVATGPNIKKNQKVYGLGLIDIAPTILNHFNLPVGRDMDGKVALEIFKNPNKIEYVDSWENIKGDFGELKDKESLDVFSDEETMQQLIELGYIDKPEGKIEIAVHKTKCDLKQNLARVHLGKKNYSKAKEILLELIEEKEPIDVSSYFMDLVTISLEEKDYESARDYLKKLKSVKTDVKYALFFAEASILHGIGKSEKAIEVLEKAKSERRGNNPEIWYKIGLCNYSLGKFDDAQMAYERAVEIEPDKAKYHAALAENLIELKEYEEAAESALTSIELVKYYSKAHYVLGRALDKLGDLENAKIAYETASRLTPKKFYKAEQAIENIEEKLNLTDKNTNSYKKDQIVIVSGLPRSGTSMMMQMLYKGGIKVLTDEKRKADRSNPKGYFEYEPVMSIHKDNSWLSKAENKSVKVVAPLLKHLDSKFRYKIIFMNRDLNEVVKSQQIMTGRNPDELPVKLLNAFKKQLKKVEAWKDSEPGVELIYLNYKDVLQNPIDAADKIESFIGVKMEKNGMVQSVDKTLYRNKS